MEIVIEKIGQGVIETKISGEIKKYFFKQGKQNHIRPESLKAGMVIEIKQNPKNGKYEVMEILGEKIISSNPENLVMVGISTQQNITNVGAAIMLSVKEFLFIETEKSKNDGWSLGSKELFKKRKIEYQELYTIQQKNSQEIGILIKDIFKNLENFKNIIWNMGGGQKIHQMIFHEVFNLRIIKGYNDRICYLNQNVKKLEIYKKENNELILEESKFLKINMTLEERILVADPEIKVSKKNNIFSKKMGATNSNIKNFYAIEEFRKFLFELSGKNNHESERDISEDFNMTKLRDFLEERGDNVSEHINEILKEKGEINKCNFNPRQLKFFEIASKNIKNEIIKIYLKKNFQSQSNRNIKIKNSSLKNILLNNKNISLQHGESIKEGILPLSNDILSNLTGHAKHADYFERILEESICNFLKDSENIVLEAYSNVETQKNKKQVAEYDILLLTEQGTIITLDAKTFDITQKDLDARVNNLRKIGGDYIQFIPVFPYYPEDIHTDYFPQKLRELPVALKGRNMEYYTYNNEIKNRKIILGKEEIDLNPLSIYLEKLKK